MRMQEAGEGPAAPMTCETIRVAQHRGMNGHAVGPVERSGSVRPRRAAEILSSDKHQLVEGLVVECLFDQIVSSVPVASQDVVALDVESVVVDTGRSIDRR